MVHGGCLVLQVVVVIDLLSRLLNLRHLGISLVKFLLEFVGIECWLFFVAVLVIIIFFLLIGSDFLVKGSFGLSQLLIELLLAFLFSLDSLLAIMLDVLDSVTSGNHILASHLKSQLNPLQELAHHQGEVLNFLLVEVLDVLSQEGNLLVFFEVATARAPRLVVAHLLEQTFVDVLLGQLEVQSVGASFANLLARVSQ